MTKQSFSSTREWLGHMRQSRIPQLSGAEIDQAMRECGYPASRNTWTRLMYRGAITQHVVTTLALVMGVPRAALATDPVFDQMPVCCNPRCEH